MLNPLPSLLILFGLVGLLIILKKPKVKSSDFSKLLEKLLVRLRIVSLRIDQTTSRFLNKIRKQRNLKDDQSPDILSGNSAIPSSKEGTSSLGENKEGINFLLEETKLLRELSKTSQEEETLINLARLYLWRKDFPSARGTLVQAYRLYPNSRITYTLIAELTEKEKQNNQPE